MIGELKIEKKVGKSMKKIGMITGAVAVLIGFVLFFTSAPSGVEVGSGTSTWDTNWETTNSARDRTFNNQSLTNINQQTFYANVLTAERLETINENLQILNNNLQTLSQAPTHTGADLGALRSTLFALTLILSGTMVAVGSLLYQEKAPRMDDEIVEIVELA